MPAPKNAETVPAVPSSTSEVVTRTMASDLEMMGKSGGLVPAAQVSRMTVTPDNSLPTGALGVPPAYHTAEKQESSWVRPLIWTLITIAGAAILFAVGFYLVPLFLNR